MRSSLTGRVPLDLETAVFMAVFHPEIRGRKLKGLLS
jgi:hypothetical protein